VRGKIMSDNIIEENKGDNSQEKKKQKAGLNGVRPDGYIEDHFKEMAKDNNLSQTKLFERMFWNYITDNRGEKRENAISFDAELSLLSTNLENIMQNVKSIATKSQDTVVSLKSNTDQMKKNLNIETETLKLRIEEITNRNTELENTNKVFSEIREGLESKISNHSDIVLEGEVENKKLREVIKEKDNEIKSYEEKIRILEKDNKGLSSDNLGLLEKITQRDIKLSNLESTNVSLQNTVNSMESLRKSEISSIESRYKTEIAALSSKITESDTEKEKEITLIKTSLKAEYEADKKMALAEVILDLADMKGKYAELYGKFNNVSNRKKSTNK
jgi:DNA repair exonuclease SbcCD ATPase subunit